MKKNTKVRTNAIGIMLISTAFLLASCCTAVNLEESKQEVKAVNESSNVKTLSDEEIDDIHNAIKVCTLSDRQSKKYEEKELPLCDTWFKSYISYKAITNTNSDQYKIQQSAWTDENGLRRYGDDYIVAVGTYYADACYTRFKVKLDSGSEIIVMVGDIKQDVHTDDKNQYSTVTDSNGQFISANVLEFIVDTSTLNKKAKNLGSVHCIDGLEGNIISIKKIKSETGLKV